MPTWRNQSEDPRTTDELIRVALTELDLSDEEYGSATAALVALQFRPTREVLERASGLCRSATVDERRLGVRVLAELRDLEDVGAALPAFVAESMEVLLGLAGTERDGKVLVEVARAFGYRKDPRGAEPLLGWRDDPDDAMRFFVACSLPRCRSADNEERVIGALIELTDDEDDQVRDYALFGLRELEVDRDDVRDAMLRRVRDPDSSVAGEALHGLAMLRDERGIEPLTEYLRDAPPGRAFSYGLYAATAYADPRLLPSLRVLEERHGKRPALREAIQACADVTDAT